MIKSEYVMQGHLLNEERNTMDSHCARRGTLTILLASLVVLCVSVHATVPTEINHQGKVEVNGMPFNGSGQFKFAIVDTTGTLTFWSNNDTSTSGSEPTSHVLLNVSKGIYSVRLGDTSYAGMTHSITSSVFNQPDRWLRIWFNDTTHGFQKLGPDQKLASVPYALMAQTVPDNSINGWKLQRESVWPEHEGRSNTIVSYFASGSGTDILATWEASPSIPQGKTFVITDICISNAGSQYSRFTLQYKKDSLTTVLWKGHLRWLAERATNQGAVQQGAWAWAYGYAGGAGGPINTSFKGGLPVPSGATLEVIFTGTDIGCTISGFEFTN
ncbi:hypothetical protein ACFL34_03360 [Candidatus Sumerlaeota bacterium]